MVSGHTSNQSEQLQLNLLDNALDSLLSAAEAVRRDEGPRSLKEAVLHLANGVELLIKARLAREHWSLIFSNINQASYGELTKADFASVDFPIARKRLEQIARVSIDKSIISHIDTLRKLRNQLTHFTATLDPVQTKSLVAKSMTSCVEFCEQQEMATSDVQRGIGEIQMNLTELEEFVDGRMKGISKDWKDALVWECPACWQQALVIDAGNADCKFCKNAANPHELAVDNAEGTVEDCPECGEELTFAFVLYNNDDGEWVCFSCGQSGEGYDHCIRCDGMEDFTESDAVKICSSCWSDIMSRR